MLDLDKALRLFQCDDPFFNFSIAALAVQYFGLSGIDLTGGILGMEHVEITWMLTGLRGFVILISPRLKNDDISRFVL